MPLGNFTEDQLGFLRRNLPLWTAEMPMRCRNILAAALVNGHLPNLEPETVARGRRTLERLPNCGPASTNTIIATAEWAAVKAMDAPR